MRAFLFADLLQRTMRTVGKYDVRWVMNITDIDDKTIRDSSKGSQNWLPQMGVQTDSPLDNLKHFTKFYEQAFLEDIAKLGIEQNHFIQCHMRQILFHRCKNLLERFIIMAMLIFLRIPFISMCRDGQRMVNMAN